MTNLEMNSFNVPTICNSFLTFLSQLPSRPLQNNYVTAPLVQCCFSRHHPSLSMNWSSLHFTATWFQLVFNVKFSLHIEIETCITGFPVFFLHMAGCVHLSTNTHF